MMAVAVQPSVFPVAAFHECTPAEANALLVAWRHRMGPLNRGSAGGYSIPLCHVLVHEGRPVAVTAASSLVREHVGGGLSFLTRDNTIELSRLCAARPALCRVALRLWREFVFPALSYSHAISYQDADIHTGNTYRFDGWKRVGYSASGTDQRSGRRGRRKWIWVWPPDVDAAA